MAHKKHHSDPMVGGVSESEGKRWGQGEFANMPKEIRMNAYPKASEYGPDVLDDTMGHVDTVNKSAHTKSRKYTTNQH